MFITRSALWVSEVINGPLVSIMIKSIFCFSFQNASRDISAKTNFKAKKIAWP